jgi:hypothetical protein
MALEALDSVDEPSEGGGGALATAAPPVQVAQAPAKSPYTIGKLPGTVPVGPTILEQMQQLLAERQAQKAAYSNYVEDAVAAAMDPEYRLQAMSQRQGLKERRDQEIFQMQNQIAQFQAAQEQAKRQAASIQGLLGGAPGAPGVGGGAPAGAAGVSGAPGTTPIPPDVRAEMQRRVAMGDNAGAEQVFNKWRETSVQQSTIALNRAESYKRDIPIRLEGSNDFVMVDALTAAALRSAGRDTISREQYDRSQGFGAPAAAPSAPVAAAPAPAAPSGAAPAAAAPSAPVSVRNNNPGNLVGPDGKFMVFRTPEEGVAALERDLQGKLSGQSDAYKARFGTQPVTPERLAEVWSPAAAKGNTPESTTNYGKHIAKKLGINPGDTIPNTPDALQRVKQAITEFESGMYPPAAAAPAAAAPAAAAPSAPAGAKTYETMKAEKEMAREVETARQKSKIETDAKQRQEFEAAIDRPFIAETRQRANRVIELTTKDPQIAGVITQPGVKNALAVLAKEGISTPSGAIGVKGIEDAIARTNPKIDPAKRAELAGHLNQMQLDYAKLTMKGQGQISDSERELIARAVGSISDPAELIIRRAKLMEARANATEKLADLYGDGSKYRGDITAFKASPEYKAAVGTYEARLKEIGNEKISLPKAGAATPYDDAEKERAYQEWKKKQGAK